MDHEKLCRAFTRPLPEPNVVGGSLRASIYRERDARFRISLISSVTDHLTMTYSALVKVETSLEPTSIVAAG